MKDFEIKCPHCNEYIIIEEVNCAIFRHGVYKENLQQIDPHSSKVVCDELLEKNLIYGCGKPFRLEKIDSKWISICCDYI